MALDRGEILELRRGQAVEFRVHGFARRLEDVLASFGEDHILLGHDRVTGDLPTVGVDGDAEAVLADAPFDPDTLRRLLSVLGVPWRKSLLPPPSERFRRLTVGDRDGTTGLVDHVSS